MRTRNLRPEETPQGLARDGYNKSAGRYAEWSATLPSHREDWTARLIKYLGVDAATARVLELGCGAGLPTSLDLARAVGKVIATDISSAQIELAQKNLQDAQVSCSSNVSGDSKVALLEADMLKLEFGSGSIDAVVAFHSVIHLSLSDQRVLLERVFSWLRPGGLFLFNVGAGEVDEGSVAEGWLGMEGAYWSSFGTEGSRKVVREIGFEIVEDDVIEVKNDATFLWMIVRKPAPPPAEDTKK